jgi:hypothetical protein
MGFLWKKLQARTEKYEGKLGIWVDEFFGDGMGFCKLHKIAHRKVTNYNVVKSIVYIIT